MKKLAHPSFQPLKQVSVLRRYPLLRGVAIISAIAAQMWLTEDSSPLDTVVFNQSFIESLLTYSFICWFYNLSLRDRNSLNSIIKICSKITGTRQRDLGSLCDQQIARGTEYTEFSWQYFSKLIFIIAFRVSTCPNWSLLPPLLPSCKTNLLRSIWICWIAHC